jgi:hypothetical protein
MFLKENFSFRCFSAQSGSAAVCIQFLCDAAKIYSTYILGLPEKENALLLRRCCGKRAFLV